MHKSQPQPTPNHPHDLSNATKLTHSQLTLKAHKTPKLHKNLEGIEVLPQAKDSHFQEHMII